MRDLRVLKPTRGPGGWLIVPLHYSHDPTKDVEWVAQQRATYLNDSDWNREMELDLTQSSAARAYYNFMRGVHVRDDLVYNPMLPLVLCCDFNVAIMIWAVGQVVKGKPQVIKEIVGEPGIVPSMVQGFRNEFPGHPAGVIVYGDAAGNSRSTHDSQTDYDLMRLSFKNYASPVEFRVPAANPGIKARLNAVNVALKNQRGEPGLLIAEECTHVIDDFIQVELDPKDGTIRKSSKADDPYSRLTHASDGIGYWIAREWPVVEQVMQDEDDEKKKAKQPDYSGRLPGDP